MTGKAYYITTLADWQRHAARFANSHFIVLGNRAPEIESATHVADASVGAGLKPAPTTDNAAISDHIPLAATYNNPALLAAANSDPAYITSTPREKSTRILVLIEADEGVHLSLEDEHAFEALPHPLAQKPISDAAQAALSAHGVVEGATTFDAAEAAARVHPLLRHRVF